MSEIETLKVDGDYVATLREPAFWFADRKVRLCEEIYRAFSPNIQPEDIQFEAGRQPHEFSARCNLSNLGVSIRFRLANIEIWTKDRKIISDPVLWSYLIARAMTVTRGPDPMPRAGENTLMSSLVRAHSFSLFAHWRLADETVEAFVRRWIPEGPPGLSPSGFVFTSEDDRRKIVLNVEPSRWEPSPNAGFVRVVCELPGVIPEAEACETANREIASSLSAIGLSLGLRGE